MSAQLVPFDRSTYRSKDEPNRAISFILFLVAISHVKDLRYNHPLYNLLIYIMPEHYKISIWSIWICMHVLWKDFLLLYMNNDRKTFFLLQLNCFVKNLICISFCIIRLWTKLDNTNRTYCSVVFLLGEFLWRLHIFGSDKRGFRSRRMLFHVNL